MQATVPRLELRAVSKRFADIQALTKIDFSLGRNEIVGLIGDNGAGKSTLIKLITGYHTPDEGEILFNGTPVTHLTVDAARALGVETVYQERALADQQTLWRNIFIGRELSTSLGFLRVREMRRETQKLMVDAMGFTSTAITPDSIIKTLSGGEKQGIAIVRALHFDADVVILDEPAMGLSVKETDKLLEFVRAVRSAGKSAILIDHNIFHVYQLADRVVVLDRGIVAGEFIPKQHSIAELMEIMRQIAETGSTSLGRDIASSNGDIS